IDFASRHQLEMWKGYGSIIHAHALSLNGDAEGSIRVMEDGFAWLARTQTGHSVPVHYAVHARALASLGRFDEAGRYASMVRTEPAGLEGSRNAARTASVTGEFEMNASPPCSSFDIDDMQWRWPGSAVIKRLLDRPQWWMGFLRRYWPIPHVPFTRWAMVTRFEHVREVLAQEQVFQVPFDRRMMELMEGPKFVLAMQDSPEYGRQRLQIMQAFRLEDVAATIAPRSAELAEQIVAGCSGRIDAIEDLLTRV